MDFSYIGSGIIDFRGCPDVEINYLLSLKFAVGSKVYDLISARRGYLEAIVIKKAWYTCFFSNILYKDTFNWIHNESDLGSQSEAITIINSYFNNKLNGIDRALANC